ncbi:hypothetical protein [Actinoallomurus sp. CA-150999]|uniref:hypothetical protein n=1 Tax=Actinoallomurus sp. CA-150999 TaxID=3239887 RepID=UPI003D93AC97
MAVLRAAGSHRKTPRRRSRLGILPALVTAWTFAIVGLEHVGLVIKDNGDGTIQTVDGNTDNAVKVRVRPASDVVGYGGYPDYVQ